MTDPNITKKTILIVDDDFYFREALTQCLQGLKLDVFTAENVEHAKKLIPLKQPDFILSDVRMPGESGIDLLKWVIPSFPKTKFILMTGFSELLESIDAIQLGAIGILAKPFREKELVALIDASEEKKSPVKDAPSSPQSSDILTDEDFSKIPIEDFISGKSLNYDIFIRLESDAGGRYIKVAHSGEDIAIDRIESFKSKNVHFLFIKKNDFYSYLGFVTNITNLAIKSNSLTRQRKARLISSTLSTTGKLFDTNVFSKQDYSVACSNLEMSIGIFGDYPNGLEALEAFKESSDKVYTHSIAVSMLSVMIARKLKWNSLPHITKLSSAAFLHDIGKKEISKQILDKPRIGLTPEEITILETHPRRGMEILNNLGFVPSEVIQAIYQHHENSAGTGYPNHLRDSKISSFAKVLSTANEFANLYYDENHNVTKDLKKCLEQFVMLHSNYLDPSTMLTIFEILKQNPPDSLLEKRNFRSLKVEI